MAVKTLTHLVDLRGKIRSVVLAASGDGGDDGEPLRLSALATSSTASAGRDVPRLDGRYKRRGAMP